MVSLAIDDYVSEAFFDANGNRVSETVNGRTTVNNFDALNRVTSTTDPMGNTSRTLYDPEGRTVQKIDPLGRVTSYTFDGAGRMKRRPLEMTQTYHFTTSEWMKALLRRVGAVIADVGRLCSSL